MGDKVGYSYVLAHNVAQLVRDEVLPELFRLVREEIEGEWKTTHPDEPARREAIYHELHAFTRVELRIQSILDDVKMKEAR